MLRSLVGMGMVVAGLWLALAAPAAALCTCGDRDNCFSAAACVGKSPGDACTGRRTCKIKVGTGNDLNCCCGCSPGAGPIGCNYGGIGVAATLEGQLVSCNAERLTRVANKAAKKADAKLGQADAACQNEKRADKKANAAGNQLTRLGKKIDRLEQRGEVTPECAESLRGLLQDLTGSIDAVEAGGGGGPTTTTTTLPAGPGCSGSFFFFDPNEVDILVQCLNGGPFDGFTIMLADGRTVTNWLAPPGFECSPTQGAIPNDSLTCFGPLAAGTPLEGGRIRTTPAPVAGMGGSLFVQQAKTQLGPFPMSGPE